ncbi:MAG: fructosamine kinase family protein [Synechococcaceae cyanobacterium SM2_3_60]|nr:fructosamine kinase family protein [Synechococcaceae cyanobacterium SM2_3_60]
MWPALELAIATALEHPFRIDRQQPLGSHAGGTSYGLQGSGQHFFVKLGDLKAADRLSTEGQALKIIADSQTIGVPRPVTWGVHGDAAYLVMEWLEFSRPLPESPYWLGEQLAAMHRVTAVQFGWHSTNTIGETLQLNGWYTDWVDFYRSQRLEMQLRLARSRGYGGAKQAERLLEHLDTLFKGYTPAPSLLHGDLWSGNCGYGQQGQPFIFDPALYYGDRETDIAMTELFGGFPAAFYESYEAHFPMDGGYVQRRPLYQLYHLLNHLNIFGQSYAGQVERVLRQCLDYAGL